MHIQLSTIVKKVFKLLIVACILLAFYLLLGITTFATFKVPTDSMEPALLPGDCIWVNKWVMGARIFNILDALDGKELKIKRLPSLGKVKRNDVLVFNFPYPERWDSIGMDVMKYYVKRCVALPGDTFEIKDAHYRVYGYGEVLGNIQQQDNLCTLLSGLKETTSANEKGICFKAYPLNDIINWSIMDFGPFFIPAKGALVEIDVENAVLYRNAIMWEQKKQLTFCGDTILLGDSIICEYCFHENYYFVVGDHSVNSQDSRYWGVLPESYIVGKAVRIWKSVDRGNDKIRWNRIFKKIE